MCFPHRLPAFGICSMSEQSANTLPCTFNSVPAKAKQKKINTLDAMLKKGVKKGSRRVPLLMCSLLSMR